MVKTTKKDFEIFKKECQKWIEILGLKDWHFWFEHAETGENCIAQYEDEPIGRSCVTYFTTGLSEKLSIHDIKSAAFHEMIELYLNDLRKMAMEKFSYNEVDKATHRIVRMLEHVLFPKY